MIADNLWIAVPILLGLLTVVVWDCIEKRKR